MKEKRKTEREQETAFDHEKLEVYQVALEYLALIHETLSTFPAGSADLKDQLGRAGSSIVLNIPEGNAKPRHSRDRRKFFRIALGSAQESAGGWDVARIRVYCSSESAARAKGLLHRIVCMLCRMVM